MERLFILIFIGLALFAGFLFYLIRWIFIDDEDPENNFGTINTDGTQENIVQSVPREHVAYQERQSSLISAAIKKAPQAVMTTIIMQLALAVFFGYLSVTNIERISMAGSALLQGEYGMVLSALWPIGKDAGMEQWRVARGKHSYLKKNELYEFVYIGKMDDKNVAIMVRLYSTQDHDESLSVKNESYGNVIKGLSASRGKEICEDKYDDHNGNLLSFEEWDSPAPFRIHEESKKFSLCN